MIPKVTDYLLCSRQTFLKFFLKIFSLFKREGLEPLFHKIVHNPPYLELCSNNDSALTKSVL